LNNWNSKNATLEDKLEAVREGVIRRGMSYRDFAARVGATKNQIASFIYNHRPELYGGPARPKEEHRPKDEPHANSFHTEASLTAKWSKKQREVRNPSPVKRPGSPLVIPPGSDIEREFRQLWAAGTMYKIMAEELGVSVKALKDARKRLGLKTRRPNMGKGIDFRLRLDPASVVKLRRGTTRTGSTRAAYLRSLIWKDNP
jgi:hypothetical protein